MSNNLIFTGSNINAGNYRGFSFYLTAEGASEVISEDVTMTSLYFPTTTGSAYLTDDVYLNIWEGDGTNAYTYLGSSTNADHCTESKAATWNFSGLALSPSKKYLVLFYSSVSSSFSNTSQARIPVFAVETIENTHTVFSSAPSNPPTSTAQAWAPCMTLTFGLPHTDTNTSLKLKVMTSAQLADEEIDSNQFYINNDTKQLLLGNKFLVGPKNGTLVNTATGTNSLSVSNNPTSANCAINIGAISKAAINSIAYGYAAESSTGGTAIGRSAKATGLAAVAVGYAPTATKGGSIMLGNGTNTEENTFKVALTSAQAPATNESTGLFTLLQSNGLIPAARLGTVPSTAGSSYYKITTDGQGGVTPSWSSSVLENLSSNDHAIAIGQTPTYFTTAESYVSIGEQAESATGAVTVGPFSWSDEGGTTVGAGSMGSGTNSVAIGNTTVASGASSIAIGNGATASANDAIMVGHGTNSTAGTMAVGLGTGLAPVTYTLLDANGNIPADRLGTLPAADGNYTLRLTIASGVPTITWVKYTAVETVSELPAQSADNTVYVITGEE